MDVLLGVPTVGLLEFVAWMICLASDTRSIELRRTSWAFISETHILTVVERNSDARVQLQFAKHLQDGEVPPESLRSNTMPWAFLVTCALLLTLRIAVEVQGVTVSRLISKW